MSALPQAPMAQEGPRGMYTQAPPDSGGGARYRALEDAIQTIRDIVLSDNIIDEHEQLLLAGLFQEMNMHARAQQAAMAQPEEGGEVPPSQGQPVDMNPFAGPGGVDIPGMGPQ